MLLKLCLVYSALLICCSIHQVVATSASCDASLSKMIFEESNDAIEAKTLYISSPYEIQIVAGDSFAAWINGTDLVTVDVVLAGENVTLVFKEDKLNVGNTPTATGGTPTPSNPNSPGRARPLPVSSGNERSLDLALSFGIVGAIRFLSKKGLIVFIFGTVLLSLVSGIESRISGDVQCPSATITVQVPRYKVRYICINDQQCVCGPGYAGEQCQIGGGVTPVNAPIKAPVADPPGSAPVSAPVNAPVNAPINEPVAAPIDAPIDAPLADPPVDAPVDAPVDVPLADPPVDVPIATPVDAPVDAPIYVAPNDPPIDSCSDGIQNGDETDIDCGGLTCPGCADGKVCKSTSDCAKGIECIVIVPPFDRECVDHCNNDITDESETDTDCGGGVCDKCAVGKGCSKDSDCESNFCNSFDNQCYPATCNNIVKDGSETGVDCGGPSCPKCFPGATCLKSSDCLSDLCVPVEGYSVCYL